MAVAGKQVLGVDINDQQIAVVEMRGSWPTGHILRADVVKTPRGSVTDHEFVDPAAIADALRLLLERMGVGTQDAVIGVAARHVVTRVLEVPSVPDHELKMVIEGELAHYQILSAQSAMIDFHRLPEVNDRPGSIPQVLAVAADQNSINAYTSIAEMAGLKIVALEPALSGMYRAAFLQLERYPASVCVAIGSSESEIVIVDAGNIRLHRRIDIGSDNLIYGRTFSGFANHADVSGSFGQRLVGEDEIAGADVSASGLVSESVDYLATELRRSIEYYNGQRPNAAAMSGVVVATDDPAMEPMAAILANVVGAPADVARLPVVWAASRGLAARLEPPHDMQFITAAGLAMHELANPPFALPRFDLSARQRVDPKVEYSRNRLAAALIFSTVCAIIAIYGGLSYGAMARRAEVELLSARSRLATLEGIRKQQTDTIELQIGLLRTLRHQGYPLARIVDSIATSLGSYTGLTNLAVTDTGEVTADGEAADDKGVLATLNGMKESPYFLDTSLQSFGHIRNAGASAPIVQFQITSHILGAPVPAAPAKNP